MSLRKNMLKKFGSLSVVILMMSFGGVANATISCWNYTGSATFSADGNWVKCLKPGCNPMASDCGTSFPCSNVLIAWNKKFGTKHAAPCNSTKFSGYNATLSTGGTLY